MKSIDLTPLYRTGVGFDHLSSLLNNALRTDAVSNSYPPYNIEVLGENRYAITLSVAGFSQAELDINIDKNVLSVRGRKESNGERQFLHQGIANRAFERKFNLADHVEVKGADLANGLLTINLVREIPEAMKPRTIAIGTGASALENVEQESANQSEAVNHSEIKTHEEKIA
ncbi:Hsp20 family protein [Halioxenophilus sp. WMMB6]|uniref:Hsp20 family protein n=1 Tax=Halioxenophilus sp. WMMB6 TaxID=3073815 RepID=UPI00295E8E47|nr:Hsp20 family protein [Halioxenophilus sp. WMMB6]